MKGHLMALPAACMRATIVLVSAMLLLTFTMLGAAPTSAATGPNPVVLFPAFHFTKLAVTVQNQTVAPDCPATGVFQDWFQNPSPSTIFSQVCRDELLTLRYDPNPLVPMPQRFSNQAGVTVNIIDYGTTQSAPFYESMYQRLEAAGYVRNVSIRVAGYDARLTPDMAGFLARTMLLIENTSASNGGRRVHLVAHSNGPLYAQYLLTHTTQAWKDRYIQGFTPIAGNFPGQGALYPILFTGLNIIDFSFPTTSENAISSARMYLSAPSSYMSAADPRIFGTQETVVANASTGTSYTPADWPQLLADAGLQSVAPIANFYIGFVKFADPADFREVDVYAEKGSGIQTLVGIQLASLAVGQVIDPATATFFERDGDINQEDITNNAVGVWAAMPCFHFSLTDNPGVDHFSLPGNPLLLSRLVADAARRSSNCV